METASTVIVPFHRDKNALTAVLAAIRSSLSDAQIVVVADGADEDVADRAAAYDATLISLTSGPRGPAYARNRAAELARGGILLFVDADVVVESSALPRMVAYLQSHTDVAAVFGAYDLGPTDPGMLSQLKNLSHAYVHEISAGDVSTFWAGLGAVRTPVFREVGGFDERFRRPSVEDIDLGYRIVRAGYRLVLNPAFRATHLKRWTLSSIIRTDLFARGIPWTQLLRRYRPSGQHELNLRWSLRLSVLVSYALLFALLLVPWFAPASVAVVALVIASAVLNGPQLAWFARQRGLLFATRSFPILLIHHLCNGLSFAAGTALWEIARLGIVLPGALSPVPWDQSVRESRTTLLEPES